MPGFGQRVIQSSADSISANAVPPTRPRPTFKKFATELIFPTLLFCAGAYSIQYKYDVVDWRQQNYPKFRTHADDFMQYAPLVAMYALTWSNVKGQTDGPNETVILLKSAAIMTVVVLSIQHSVNEYRPDNSNKLSFPSGHMAQAFIAATMLHKEFGHRSIWYSIGGYTVATSIAVLRILNNAHFITDIFVGAGIGVLSTNLVYLTHKYHWGKDYKKKKNGEAFYMPTFNNGPGIYFCYRFK